MKNDRFPRILIVSIARINNKDQQSNGLLLRNLFGEDWPKERTAQIFSSGDNGDPGFFGRYYQMGSRERRFGNIFYFFKSRRSKNIHRLPDAEGEREGEKEVRYKRLEHIRRWFHSVIVDTGIYELFFMPKISRSMELWIKDFNPDVIFAQGYNLTFASLPILIKNKFDVPIATLTSDDWPSYQYNAVHGEPKLFRWLVRPFVRRFANDLFEQTDIPLAFGHPMAQEYNSRYGKEFVSLYHSDDAERFRAAPDIVLSSENEKIVLVAGSFNAFRAPLLIDAAEACANLNAKGLNVRLVVIPTSLDEETLRIMKLNKKVSILRDPGNDVLPSYLKSSDVLLLLESFNNEFVDSVKLSISSKAHLFMFSEKPIVVYSNAEAGVAKYAKHFRWADLVCERSVDLLSNRIHQLINDVDMRQNLIQNASNVAKHNHTISMNRGLFLKEIFRIFKFN